MARRCGNCIHKNVCELYDIVQDPTHAVGCGNFLDTADVVPKSEYDEVLSSWQKIHDSYDADCIEHYKYGRAEVAREIFEEIEKVVGYALCVDLTDWSAFNELKKKYTEEF